MFDKNELSIILRSLELYKTATMASCIYCDIVDYRDEYAKTKYCVAHCGFCKDIKEIESLIFKLQEVLK